VHVATVVGDDLVDLLPLLRGYCDFYEAEPSDEKLLELARSLIADHDCEGFQVLARDCGRALGFATVYWSWSTLSAKDNLRAQKLYERIGGRRAEWLDYLLDSYPG
jgi:hypothetical protein